MDDAEDGYRRISIDDADSQLVDRGFFSSGRRLVKAGLTFLAAYSLVILSIVAVSASERGTAVTTANDGRRRKIAITKSPRLVDLAQAGGNLKGSGKNQTSPEKFDEEEELRKEREIEESMRKKKAAALAEEEEEDKVGDFDEEEELRKEREIEESMRKKKAVALAEEEEEDKVANFDEEEELRKEREIEESMRRKKAAALAEEEEEADNIGDVGDEEEGDDEQEMIMEMKSELRMELRDYETAAVLDLTGRHIGDAGVEVVVDKLPELTSLVHLNLRGNAISDVGAWALTEALLDGVCPALEILTLSDNWLTDEGVSDIARALPGLKNLRQLHLAQNEVTDSGLMAIAVALENCTKLEALFLGMNEISIRGAKILADVIPWTSISMLRLSGNDFWDEGAEALAAGRFQNLTALFLGNCKIESGGAVAIAQALPGWTRLRHLYLNDNNLGDIGGEALVKALPNCTELQVLGLSNTGIGDTVTKALNSSGKVFFNKPWETFQGMDLRARAP